MQQFLSNGGFAKMMSTIIQSIFVLGIGALLFIEGYHNQPFNPYLLTFLGVILGHQATVLTGVQSQGDLLNALSSNTLTSPAVAANTASMDQNTQALEEKIAALTANTTAINNAIASIQTPDPTPTQPKIPAIGVTTNG